MASRSAKLHSAIARLLTEHAQKNCASAITQQVQSVLNDTGCAVVDCCDGTDEPPGRCMNTCLEAGATARADLKAKAAAYAAGAQVREGYIKRAGKTRAEWQAQLKRVNSQTSAQQQKVDAAKGRPPLLGPILTASSPSKSGTSLRGFQTSGIGACCGL